MRFSSASAFFTSTSMQFTISMVVGLSSHCACAKPGRASKGKKRIEILAAAAKTDRLLRIFRSGKFILPGASGLCLRSVDFARDGDAGLSQDVGDLRLAEARSVVLERQVVLVVDAEAAQAIGVGEFAEVAELVVGEGGLQFVGDFNESHGGSIAGCSSGGGGQGRARLDFHRG